MATLGSSLLATTLLGSAAIAVAQPAGDMPPPDAGATGGAPAGADAGAPIRIDEPAPPPPPDVSQPPPVEEPPAKDAKPAISMTYDKGVVFKTADDEFELKLALRSQMRFESTRSLGDGAQFASSFYLPRTRLQLEGHAFGEDHGYKVEIGLGDKGSFSFVKEAYIDWAIGSLVLRTGQYKRPFSRQELTSDFGSEFNERSIANEFAGGGRDLGVMIHNNFEKSPEGLEFAAGIFNGFSGGSDKPKTSIACVTDPVTMEVTCTGGTPSNVPADFSPALVARAAFNHGKIKGYSEIDLEGGPLRASVGLNYKVDLANFDKGAEDSVFANFSHGLGVDAIIKANGLDASIGAYLMKAKSADALFAGYAQGGYLLQPKVHVGARVAFAQEDADVTALEARAAFSYLIKGNQLKIATDVGILTDTADGTDPDLQIRVMPQLTF